MNQARDFGDAIMTSLSGAMAMLFGAVPKILAFLAIVIVGWLIASLAARAIAAVLRGVNFNQLAQTSGFSTFIHDMGMQTDASGFIASVSKWFIRLLALIVGFDALGLPAVSQVLQELLLWLPNLVVAVVVLVVAGLAADALAGLVRGATTRAGFENAGLVAAITRVAVWSFGIIVAVNQLGIAVTLVNTLFTAFVGAIALAAGLAFGLGGRDAAQEWLAELNRRLQIAKPKIVDAASKVDVEDASKNRT